MSKHVQMFNKYWTIFSVVVFFMEFLCKIGLYYCYCYYYYSSSYYYYLEVDKSQAYGRPIVAALYCKGRQQFCGLFCTSFVIFFKMFLFLFFSLELVCINFNGSMLASMGVLGGVVRNVLYLSGVIRGRVRHQTGAIE